MSKRGKELAWVIGGGGAAFGLWKWAQASNLKDENAALLRTVVDRNQQIDVLTEQLRHSEEARATAQAGRQRAENRASAAESERNAERNAHAATRAVLAKAQAEASRLPAELANATGEMAKACPPDPAAKSSKSMPGR